VLASLTARLPLLSSILLLGIENLASFRQVSNLLDRRAEDGVVLLHPSVKLCFGLLLRAQVNFFDRFCAFGSPVVP